MSKQGTLGVINWNAIDFGFAIGETLAGSADSDAINQLI